MIKSIQEYFIPTQYWREVTKEDKEKFEKRTLKGKDGKRDETFFYNPKTKECTWYDPKNKKKLLLFDKERFTFEKLYKTMFKGAVIGLIVSGAPTLVGYYIVKVKYGALIGSALGAIKVYVDSTKGKTRNMLCCTYFNPEEELPPSDDDKFRRGLGIKPKEKNN